MKYCRFLKSSLTQIVDSKIDLISKVRTVDFEDMLTADKFFFIGGPFSSLEKIKKIKENNINFINIDKGYLRNKKTTSHWRMSFNSFQQLKILDVPADRLENNFKIEIKKWQRQGSYILILAPGVNSLNLYYQTSDILDWSLRIKNKLLEYTDRKIFIRFKDSQIKKSDPLIKYLDNCYAIITLQSLGCVDALINGIPVISLAECCTDSLFKNRMEDIENLYYPENRYEWLKSLAYSQFTDEELSSGYAMTIFEEMNNLTGRLKII
jgi:hypothetical protein